MAFTERGFGRGDDRTDALVEVARNRSTRRVRPGFDALFAGGKYLQVAKANLVKRPESAGRGRILVSTRQKTKCLLLVNAAIIIRLTVSSQSLQALRHGLARQGTRLIRDRHAGHTVGRG